MTTIRRIARAARRLPARGIAADRRRPRAFAAGTLLAILVGLLVAGEYVMVSGQPQPMTVAGSPSFTIRDGWTLADLERRIESGDVTAITATSPTATTPTGELLARTRDGQIVSIDLTVGAGEAASPSPLVLVLPFLLLLLTIGLVWRISRRSAMNGRDSASRFTTIMPADP